MCLKFLSQKLYHLGVKKSLSVRANWGLDLKKKKKKLKEDFIPHVKKSLFLMLVIYLPATGIMIDFEFFL